MPVEVSFQRLEYVPHINPDGTSSRAATVYLSVRNESPYSNAFELPFTFAVRDFATLDEALAKAQKMLVDFAVDLQTALEKPILQSAVNQ